mmetsp:Transcript_12810/g.24628  ORF Transcript_12810/g.24628 Transcript_12810/m.24628 type:complete len:292 (+) Transcript_12810:102-977(+)|eukprot:scaffold34701_cov229-Amphora_coffeaeformis.AAC.7
MSTSSTTTLLLDPDIRDWVVLPLFVIMVAAGLLRHYVGQWLTPAKTPLNPIVARQQATLKHVTKIRSPAGHYMSTWRWQVRKQHAVTVLQEQADWAEAAAEKQEGTDDDDPMSSMMNNPMGMMQGNMAFMVQNMIMMQGIQHFFSGFILLKIPFSLTAGFKNMFQKGLADLPDLDPSYVSSVSWYFLVMYGLRSFFRLAVGDPSLEYREQEQLLQRFGYTAPNPGKAADPAALCKQMRQEAENMDILLNQHKSEFDGVEKRLLGSRYPKRKVVSKDGDFLMGKKKQQRKAQ